MCYKFIAKLKNSIFKKRAKSNNQSFKESLIN